MNKSHIITITSGSYNDFSHGAICAVESEKLAIEVADILNKYAAFRTRFEEELWAWEEQVCWNDIPSDFVQQRNAFIKAKYNLTEEIKKAETVLKLADQKYLLDLDNWPEEVVFAYQALPVLTLRLEKDYGTC